MCYYTDAFPRPIAASLSPCPQARGPYLPIREVGNTCPNEFPTTDGMTLLELGKRKLVGQTKSQPRVLQHVVEAQVFDLVLRGVDLVI